MSLAIAFSMTACSGGKEAAAPEAGKSPAAAKASLSVTVTSLADLQWARSVPASGAIAAWQESAIGSEIGGLRLKELAVSVGDAVKQGQLLARLNDETVQADLAQAKAALGEAEAAFAEARANGDRARKFDGSGAISQQQSVQYLTAEQTAKARIDIARARLAAEELRLRQTRVLAPDDGVVSARSATLGAVVQPGQELFRLILRGRLEWRAEVTASELARIRPGQAATMILPSGAKASGRVRVVAPSVDTQTRNGVVYVDVLGVGEARAGMFARGEILAGEAGSGKAQTLPQSAVLLRDGFSWVFKLGADRKVQQTKVATGRRVGDRVEILSGLASADRVVESGVGFLADGDLVEVLTAPAAGKP